MVPMRVRLWAVATLESVDRRVIPGQGGNWTPARAYWCPGMPVDAVRTNVAE